MKINSLQKSQILTGALGQFTVEALQKSAMITFLGIKDAFHHKTHTLGHNYHNKNGKKFRGGWKGGKRKGHGTHVTDADGDEESAPEEEKGSSEGCEDEEHEVNHAEGGSSDGEDDKAPEDIPDVPEELEAAYQEARLFLTRAKSSVLRLRRPEVTFAKVQTNTVRMST